MSYRSSRGGTVYQTNQQRQMDDLLLLLERCDWLPRHQQLLQQITDSPLTLLAAAELLLDAPELRFTDGCGISPLKLGGRQLAQYSDLKELLQEISVVARRSGSRPKL